MREGRDIRNDTKHRRQHYVRENWEWGKKQTQKQPDEESRGRDHQERRLGAPNEEGTEQPGGVLDVEERDRETRGGSDFLKSPWGKSLVTANGDRVKKANRGRGGHTEGGVTEVAGSRGLPAVAVKGRQKGLSISVRVQRSLAFKAVQGRGVVYECLRIGRKKGTREKKRVVLGNRFKMPQRRGLNTKTVQKKKKDLHHVQDLCSKDGPNSPSAKKKARARERRVKKGRSVADDSN